MGANGLASGFISLKLCAQIRSTRTDRAQGNTMTVALLNALSRIAARAPRQRALGWGRGLGWFIGSVLRFRRAEAIRAMRRCLPEKTPREIRNIAGAMYRNLGMTLVEMARVSVLGMDELEGHVHVVGEEHIPEAARNGTAGTLILMGHIGNWELCGWASRLLKGRVSVVVKPIGSPAVDRYIAATRKRMNLDVLHFRKAYRGCLRALRDGKAVAVILDQNTRLSVGVSVPFFGRPASTSPGLAILAAQTGTPVMPVYAVRRDDYDHEVHILPAIPAPPDRNQESLTEATQHYTRVLEDIIRRYPDQWIWIHRRWKSQPRSKNESMA
jgi:KDO2-lipid IV(A) lauroyltransferase